MMNIPVENQHLSDGGIVLKGVFYTYSDIVEKTKSGRIGGVGISMMAWRSDITLRFKIKVV